MPLYTEANIRSAHRPSWQPELHKTRGREVIRRHQEQRDREILQLPLSVNALYAIHDITDEEVALCLEDPYTRSSISVTDKSQFGKLKEPQLVIHPHATGGSITTRPRGSSLGEGSLVLPILPSKHGSDYWNTVRATWSLQKARDTQLILRRAQTSSLRAGKAN